MQTLPNAHIDELAKSCVHNVGDIFWGYDERRDAPLGFCEPRRLAAESVAATLHEFVLTLESNPIYTSSLRLEYREIIRRIRGISDDQQIISMLIEEAAWTDRGAHVVLQLAKYYGTSILRNALALAEAMDIEDGEAGR
ncbi:MAG: hypothetical protein KJZ69_17540 [Phycisphaerales bacterium]|nr:hypothetical protein [Phycisphaerales bacterium]